MFEKCFVHFHGRKMHLQHEAHFTTERSIVALDPKPPDLSFYSASNLHPQATPKHTQAFASRSCG